MPINSPFKSCPTLRNYALLAIVMPLSMSATAGMMDNNLPKDPNAQLSVGANVQYVQSPYDADSQINFLPGIFYDNNKIYARGNTAGAYLINDGVTQLDAFAQFTGTGFDPDDANGALKGLDERKGTAVAGLSYLYRSPIGGLRAQVATDILGRSDGNIARLTYLAKYSTDKLTVYPSVGVEWHNEDFNDYYYGISEKEAAKTGLAAYSPGSSVNPYISISGTYDFNEKWAGFASQTIDYLADEQYDSPMVDSRVDSRTTLGLLYKF